jgi:4-amino-4-deoxy-L-arabinose transferase-like glycosyltransferase
MSDLYFRQGYAIAAGLGYVTGDDEASDTLKDIQRRVETEGLVATPQTVGPVPAGLYAETLHPPGLPLLVATLHRALGKPADLAVQLLGALLDSAAAALVFWISASIVTPAVGLVAGLLYATFLPQAWAATGAQMPDGLIGPFIVAMLAAYLQAARSTGAAAYRWYAVAGLALGLGSYFRPDYLLVPIAMLPFVWLIVRRLHTAILGSALAVVVALAVLSPWAYRNHLIYDRWIFTSSGAGAALVTGLAEFQNPWGFGATDTDRHQEAAAHGLVSAWTAEADRYFREAWWTAVRSNPGAFTVAVIKRLPLALAPPYEFGFANPLKTRSFTELRDAGEDRYQVVLRNPLYVMRAYWDALSMAAFSALALLATLWWFVTDLERRALILLIVSPHLYSIASHCIVHLEPRFLLPSMFCLLPGMAVLVTRSLNRYRNGFAVEMT